jgi:ribosomal-protein-serine acetyltransferase
VAKVRRIKYVATSTIHRILSVHIHTHDNQLSRTLRLGFSINPPKVRDVLLAVGINLEEVLWVESDGNRSRFCDKVRDNSELLVCMRAGTIICIDNSTVVLKQFEAPDAREIFELIEGNREHLSQFCDNTAHKYSNVESVRASIVHPANPEKMRLGIWDENKLIGSINLIPRTTSGAFEKDVAEIGYWVGREFGGFGYATIATRALVKYAFAHLDIVTVLAKVDAENIARRRVLTKAGFVSTCRWSKSGDIWYGINRPK